GEVAIDPKDDRGLSLLLRIGALCNNSHLEKGGEGWRILGDTTEGALIVGAAKAGMGEEVREIYPRIGEVPFSSERKRMTTVHTTPEGEKQAYVKGAPEVVIDRCAYLLQDGKPKPLNEKDREMILESNARMASEALRVIAVAFKRLPYGVVDLTDEELESGLTFVGLLGMIDPPREEAVKAVRSCEDAGIEVVMVTGDHRLTATAIATEMGILREGELVLTGRELDDLDDEEFEKIVESVAVYARVSPEHKIRIVRALKKKGHIVAMTGDGVNDAPALKGADIGVAMGITGTDVSKEASDMVLADDNFATVVAAVEGGRVIYDNIRKFIRFLLACNFDEVLVIGSFALAGLPLPLTAAMILWVNLVTDGGPAVALGVDVPSGDVMRRAPRGPREGILHGITLFIIASFLLQSLGTTLVFCWQYLLVGGMSPESVPKARTMAFMQVAFFELFVVWNCRSERHSAFKVAPWSNRLLVLSVAASALLMASLCYVPVFRAMFGTVPLSLGEWGLILFVASWGLLVLPEVFSSRGRPRPRPQARSPKKNL
ncbi:MAG: cation-translocating P-type ATPase, partial [Candidatus Bathyarchaeia archaeon]